MPPERSEPQLGTIDPRVFEHRQAMREREARLRSIRSRRRTFVAAGVLLAALGIGYAGFPYYSSNAGVRDLLARFMRETPTAVAATAPTPAPVVVAPSVSVPPPPTPIAAEPVPLPKIGSVEPEAKKVPKPKPVRPAQLVLAVSPGGELFVDGEPHGKTPPATTFDLEPGMHRIEVRSGSRKPFLTYMTLEPGDVRSIRHDFNARPSRPPS